MKPSISSKISLALVALFLSLQPLAQAADKTATAKPAAGERGAAIRQRMQEVAKELNLTDDQKAKLKPIIQAELTKLKALRADSSLSRREKLEKAKTIRAEMAPQVKAILTPEQFEKWQKMAKERRARLRGQ